MYNVKKYIYDNSTVKYDKIEIPIKICDGSSYGIQTLEKYFS